MWQRASMSSGGGDGDIKEACAICRGFITSGGTGFNGQYADTAGNVKYNTYLPTITTDFFKITSGKIYANQSGLYGYTLNKSASPITHQGSYSINDLIYDASTLSSNNMIVVYAK